MFGYNLSVRRVGKRVLSTVSEAVSNKSADGSAGEAVSSSKNTKFIIIGVPLMILGTIVTDIVCKVNHRTALEKVFPSFVALVREHYGFDDEDPSELARIKLLKAEQAKPIEVNVYRDNGVEVSLSSVDGKQSITALLESIASQDGSGSSLSLIDRIKLLQGVNFLDSNESEEMKNITTIISESKREENSRDMKPLHGDLSPLQRSVWDSLPSEPQQQQAHPTSDTQVHIRNVVYNRFLNFYQSFSTGLHEYIEQGNQRIPLGDYQLPKKEGSNAVQTKKRPVTVTASTDINKLRAKQRIQDIQLEIKELEYQKQLGIREIDAVDSDIQVKRQEITNIQRQYLNYFYYF